MKRIYVPTTGPLSWRPLLAQPDRQWKAGFSAMSVAQSWEAAAGKLPTEIGGLLERSPGPVFDGLELLIAIPEYQVELPGGERPTQTDVFAVAGNAAGLVVLAVEGKVDETFGPTVEARRAKGAGSRLDHLHKLLQLDSEMTAGVRYQLLHRTAAAIVLAQRFHARAAAMVVQSFSPESRWRDDFERFASLIDAEPDRGHLRRVGERGGVTLFLGWVSGDQEFRHDLTGSAV